MTVPDSTQGYWFGHTNHSAGNYTAELRAIALLQSWLTPEQREQFDKYGWFDVIGGDTGRRYRVNRPQIYNVHLLCECSGVMCKICFVPRDRKIQTHGDIMLMQKMALEKDELATLALANVNSGDRGVMPEYFYHNGKYFGSGHGNDRGGFAYGY